MGFFIYCNFKYAEIKLSGNVKVGDSVIIELIKKLFTKNDKAINKVRENIDKRDNSFIRVEDNENHVIIEISKDMPMNEFLSRASCIDNYKIPMKMFLRQNEWIAGQKLHIMTREDAKYMISNRNKNIRISQSKTNDINIEETVIDIDKITSRYKITRYIHSLEHSTISTKWYPLKNDTMSVFSLDKKEALDYAKELLKDLEELDLTGITSIDQLYNHLNLVMEYRYFPVISDEEITLSWPCRFGETDINDKKYEFFEILLNDTNEVIGTISYDYQTSSGFSYGGNISYNVKEQFRGNHYATKALSLLKKLLKDNKFDGDKDLYIATLPDNYQSQKVAISNNAELVYQGNVPENDSVNYIDGVKKVNVYKIKL